VFRQLGQRIFSEVPGKTCFLQITQLDGKIREHKPSQKFFAVHGNIKFFPLLKIPFLHRTSFSIKDFIVTDTALAQYWRQ
jgi:hypothetical protein